MIFYSNTLLKTSTIIKLALCAAAVMWCFSPVQADTVINFSEIGGSEMVTGNANVTVNTTYSTVSYLSPADGASGYNTTMAGQNRQYYGAMNPANVFGLAQNGGDDGLDAIQMVKNFKGAGGTATSMIAWKAADFLTTVRALESFDMEFETRGGTTTAHYLVEVGNVWYRSVETSVDSSSNDTWNRFTQNVSALTWESFSSFGVTGGSGTPDLTAVQSVGIYFTSTLASGNWTGAKLRYFKVTENSPIIQTDATYTDVAGAAAVTSSTDLVNQGQATFASSTVTANQGGETPEESFNDGITAGSFDNMTWFRDSHFPATVTLDLDVTTNTDGYNISEINSIAGWGSGTQGQQVMTVEYSVTGDAGFTTLGTFTNTAAGLGESSSIGLTDLFAGYLATGVDALRFTYALPAGTDRMVLQEIDVIGVAAGDPVAVPLDLELSSMFSDDMILQREKAVPVWGTSAPGVGITVEFDGQTKTTTTAGDGTWSVNLDSMEASAVSRDLTVTADLNSDTEVVTFSNVLVGEVWVCSGQSNMAFTIRQTVHKSSVEATPDNSTLRFYKVPKEQESTPLERLNAIWTESTTGSSGTARDFSAVAYYFGLKLQAELGVPVGLIQSADGGTSVEVWLPAGTNYNNGSAGVNYNGMIDALIPFAMRGVIWYQGENNMGDGMLYLNKKVALINGWRSLWGEEFPFYYVQLAPYNGYATDELPLFWEAQSAILNEVNNTGMAVISDSVTDFDGVTDFSEIHPRSKAAPANRLALLALENTYGQVIVSTGPTFASITRVGSSLEVTFASSVGLTTNGNSAAPDLFEIAEADGNYVTATATISSDKVILTAGGIDAPRYMRFAWSDTAQPNLRNGAGLVASSFRANVAPAAWGTWLSENNLDETDWTGNADGDSLNNLQEFAFGTDPAVSSGSSMAYGGGVTAGLPLPVLETITSNNVDFRAAFSRRKDWDTVGLTYTVQFSADLTEWVDNTETPLEIESGSGEIDAVYVPYPLAIPTSNGYEKAQFFRLSVSQD